MEYIFSSERLGFRRWVDEDFPAFAAMNQDAAVMEFFPNTLSTDQTSVFLNKIKTFFDTKGYGLYAVDELITSEFIGFIGFWHPSFDLGFSPFIEIGWRLQQKHWNKGFATEGAKACLKFGFEQLQFETIYSLTAVVNKKSIRVMEKIGMQKMMEFDHPKLDVGHRLEPHVLYRIDRMTSTFLAQ